MLISRKFLKASAGILCLLLCSSVFAANILIIESQTGDHPDHTMAAAWQDIANSMNHYALVFPPHVLLSQVWLNMADIVIVSSGVEEIPQMSYANLLTFAQMGKSVYIQSEADAASSGNERFAQLVTDLGGQFTWGETTYGDLVPMNILGLLSHSNNLVESLDYFQDGCVGFGNDTIENQFEFEGNYYGFMFTPPNVDHGKVFTNSDLDWVNQWSYPELMQNYITLLVPPPPPLPELDLTFYINPPSPVIPADGGTFSGYATIENLSDQTVTFDGWVDVRWPNGYLSQDRIVIYGMVVGPYGTVTTSTRVQNVSGGAYTGTYGVFGYVGYHPNVVLGADVFTFVKLGDGVDGWPIDEWTIFGISQGAAGLNLASEPETYTLSSAYPNPFNPTTTISVTLPQAADLSVVVFNVAGRQIAELANGPFNAGSHSLTFDASGMSSGLYFVRTTVPGELDQVQKVMLVR
jgi:Secretion system C-terminal sorting domain